MIINSQCEQDKECSHVYREDMTFIRYIAALFEDISFFFLVCVDVILKLPDVTV